MRLYCIGESECPRYYVRSALGVNAERWNGLFRRVQEWRREMQDRYAVPLDRVIYTCGPISATGQVDLTQVVSLASRVQPKTQQTLWVFFHSEIW